MKNKVQVHWLQRIIYTILYAFAFSYLSYFVSYHFFDDNQFQVDKIYEKKAKDDESDYLMVFNLSNYGNFDEEENDENIYLIDKYNSNNLDGFYTALSWPYTQSKLFYGFQNPDVKQIPEALKIYERPSDYLPDSSCEHHVMIGDDFVKSMETGYYYFGKEYIGGESIWHDIYGMKFDVVSSKGYRIEVCVDDIFHIDGKLLDSEISLSYMFFFKDLNLYDFASKAMTIHNIPKKKETLKRTLDNNKGSYTYAYSYMQNVKSNASRFIFGWDSFLLFVLFFAICSIFYFILLYVDVYNIKSKQSFYSFLIQNGIMLCASYWLSIPVFFMTAHMKLRLSYILEFPLVKTFVVVFFIVLLFYAIIALVALMKYLKLKKKEQLEQ